MISVFSVLLIDCRLLGSVVWIGDRFVVECMVIWLWNCNSDRRLCCMVKKVSIFVLVSNSFSCSVVEKIEVSIVVLCLLWVMLICMVI